MASCVDGSSQDSGSRTERLGTTSSSVAGRSASSAADQIGHLAHRQHTRIELHLQRPHAGGQLGDAGHRQAAQRLVEHVHAGPHREIECHRPVFDEDTAVAAPAQRDVGAVAGGEPAQHTVVAVAGGRDAPTGTTPGGRRRWCAATARGRRAPGRTARCRRAPSGRASSGRRRTTVTGQTNPPRLGPSGPSRIGVSPVKSSAPTQYALSWMFDGCRPASPPSVRAHCGFGPIQAHAGAVGVEVHGVVGADMRVDVGAGEELRCAVRALGDRDLPAVADAGLLLDRGPGVAVRARSRAGPGSAPAVSASPARKRPAVVAAERAQRESGCAAQVFGLDKAAGHQHVAAHPGPGRACRPRARHRRGR